jgi:pyrroline-5-carboxylate reductase
MKVTFIGGGVMAEAIISSAISKLVLEPSCVTVSDPLESRRLYLVKQYSINTEPENYKAIQDSQLIVLAIKPQDLDVVANSVGDRIKDDQVILSIAAGIPLSTLERIFSHNKIVRAMPNTPAQVGAGITVWATSSGISEQDHEMAQLILSSIGKEIYVADEKYLDMATAISGSGPGYVFLIMESLVDAGVNLGLTRAIAEELVVETFLGSATLARNSDNHLSILRNMVTSPGGTTAAGLMALEESGLRWTLASGVIAAYKKSKLLGDLK